MRQGLEISLFFKQRRVFNAVSLCECTVWSEWLPALSWPLFFSLFLSGESAAVAPQSNSEYRLASSGSHQSRPLPLISNLVLVPLCSLYQIRLSRARPNKSYFMVSFWSFLINVFPFKWKWYIHLTGSIKLSSPSALTGPKISCFVHINTRIVGGHQVRGTDGSWVVSIQRE